MKKFALFLILALGSPFIHSQFNVTLYKIRDFRQFNSAYDQITVMEMDPAGNLWFNLYNTWGGAGMGKFTGKDWFIFNMGTDLIKRELGLYVNAFAFDLGDSVWVGTDNGLAKFNGVSPEGWEIYNSKNSPIPDNKITALAVDNKYIKWIGCSNGNLVSFDGNKWIIFDKYSGVGNKINDLEADVDGNIWMARNGTPGLVKFEQGSFIDIPGLADVRHIELGWNGQVFVTTKDKLSIIQNNEIIETIQPDPRLNCELYEVAFHPEGPFVSSNKGILQKLGSKLKLYSRDNSSLPDLVPPENYNPVPLVYDGMVGLWFSFIYEGISASYASIGHMDKIAFIPPIPVAIDKPSNRFCFGESLTLDATMDAANYIWDGVNTKDRTYTVYDTKTVELTILPEEICMMDTLITNVGDKLTDSLICMQSSQVALFTSVDVIAQHVFEDEVPCVVTVSQDYKNLLAWEKTSGWGTASYNIYKEMPVEDTVEYIFIDNVSEGRLSIFKDLLSDPRKKSAKYKIASVDTCGNESGPSYYHKTMHLQVSPGMDTTIVNLDWEIYEGAWFPYYIVYKGTDPENLYPVDSVAWNNVNRHWTDIDVDGHYYYSVGVKLPFVCTPTGETGKKADSGPYSHSMSQIEDNRFQTPVDEQGIAEIKSYPNPFTHWTQIDFENPQNHLYQLIVTDMSGKILRIVDNIRDNKVILLRENLPQGLYLFELKGDKLYRGKFVVR